MSVQRDSVGGGRGRNRGKGMAEQVGPRSLSAPAWGNVSRQPSKASALTTDVLSPVKSHHSDTRLLTFHSTSINPNAPCMAYVDGAGLHQTL